MTKIVEVSVIKKSFEGFWLRVQGLGFKALKYRLHFLIVLLKRSRQRCRTDLWLGQRG